MGGQAWLCGAFALVLGASCAVQVPAGRSTARGAAAPACRSHEDLVEVHNPTREPVIVSSTVLEPGWTALCVPSGSPELFAIRGRRATAGGPLFPVFTADRTSAIGYPIAVLARRGAYTTAIVDTRHAALMRYSPAIDPDSRFTTVTCCSTSSPEASSQDSVRAIWLRG